METTRIYYLALAYSLENPEQPDQAIFERHTASEDPQHLQKAMDWCKAKLLINAITASIFAVRESAAGTFSLLVWHA